MGHPGYRREIPDEKVISRCQRLDNPTLAERVMFAELQRFRTLGFIFRRERMVLGWCLDFYCAKRRLAIEVDGGYHAARRAEDARRDAVLGRKLLIKVLRFTNEQVIHNTEWVVSRILEIAHARPVYRSWNQDIVQATAHGRKDASGPAAARRRITPAAEVMNSVMSRGLQGKRAVSKPQGRGNISRAPEATAMSVARDR